MPTENRSSNTEMVSVPTLLAADNDRDMLEYLAEAVETQTYGCDHCGHEEPLSTFDIASDLRDYMRSFPDAPTPQPHPDPIAWMVGTAIWWTKEEAERDAAETGLPIVGLGPMTDAGEVERLRTERKRMDEALVACADERDELRKANTEFEAQVASDFKFIDDLRAQLGGAHSLLREADEFMYIMTGHDSHARLAHQYGEKWWNAIDKLRGKVCTVLSAGAAPQVKS